ncbi:Conserved_hypothetical protein [Hexamita inflata]|uniref:Transmembrane protein n=1 Tax=Hexamita inflata TaxID=28002 RepID=A0ABP1LNP6_9EUKA
MIQLCIVYMNKLQRNIITNCYTKESYLELDKNLQTFTIFLVSSNNIQCNIFPNDVYVNLTLSHPHIKQLQIYLDDFYYTNTVKIIFPLDYDSMQPGSSLEDGSQLKYARFSIYSLSEITSQEIIASYIKQSNLQECFTLIGIILFSDNIKMTTYPQNICRLQISNTNSESKMIGMSIVVNENEFTFNSTQIQNFINCYQNTNCYEVESILQADMSEIILQQFHTAKLKILSHQGTIDVSIEYPVHYISVAAPNNYFQYSLARIFIQNNSFILSIELEQYTNKSILQQQFDQLIYTKVIQRLSCRLNSKQFTYQNTVQGYYNISEQQFRVSCNEGTQNQQQYCQQFYNYAYDNTQTECHFDILLYNNNICSYIEKIQLITTFTCVKRFWLTQNKNNICVSVQYKVNSLFCQKLFETAYLYDILYLTKFENNLYQEGKIKDQYGMVKYVQIESNSTSQFCYNCSDSSDQYISSLNSQLKCNQISKFVKFNNNWKLSMYNDQSISSSFIQTDYKIVKYMTMIIGSITLIISLVFCFIQIKQTRSLMNEVKNKKIHKHKLT